jgi:hypothetical protein
LSPHTDATSIAANKDRLVVVGTGIEDDAELIATALEAAPVTSNLARPARTITIPFAEGKIFAALGWPLSNR